MVVGMAAGVTLAVDPTRLRLASEGEAERMPADGVLFAGRASSEGGGFLSALRRIQTLRPESCPVPESLRLSYRIR